MNHADHTTPPYRTLFLCPPPSPLAPRLLPLLLLCALFYPATLPLLLLALLLLLLLLLLLPLRGCHPRSLHRNRPRRLGSHRHDFFEERLSVLPHIIESLGLVGGVLLVEHLEQALPSGPPRPHETFLRRLSPPSC